MPARHFSVVFMGLQPSHIPKDVVQLPSHVALKAGWQASIITTGDEAEVSRLAAASRVPVVTAGPVTSRWANLVKIIWCLARNRKHLDVVLLYHVTVESAVISRTLRTLAHGSMVLLKLDSDARTAQGLLRPPSLKSRVLRDWVLRSPVSACVVETYAIHDQLASLFAARDRRLEVVPNGFVGDALTMQPVHTARRARVARSSPLTRMTVLAVARHGTEQKRSELLLDAVDRLDNELASRVKLVLVGPATADFTELLDRFAQSHPHLEVRHLPWCEPTEMRDLLVDADAYVAVTAWESFGLATLEAVAAGVPCIATSVGVVPDLVSAGAPIRVLPPNPTAEVIAREITEVLLDQACSEARGRRGAAVATQWSYDVVVDRLVEVIESAERIRGRGRRGWAA
jgi:glycosyltransferase involved in cell wall biosynthesis